MQKVNYDQAKLSKVHKTIFLSFALGQISCSYALGIAGTALSSAQGPLNLSSFWMGLLGAGTLIGLFGSVFMGRVADNIGRKKLFVTDMLLFTLLSVLQFFTSNLVLLLLLRVGIGLTIAIDYTVGSALLTEWFPFNQRAKFQSTLLIFWMIGFVASYLVGTFIPGLGADTWRWIISSSAVFGLITAIWRLSARIPESPSWLAGKGKIDEARELIQTHLGGKYGITDPHEQDQTEETANAGAWSNLLKGKILRNVLVGGMFYGCQVFPFFGIGIFLPLLMAKMNIGDPNLPGILYNVFMLVGVLIGVYIFNKVSRRSFLLSTFYISAAALAIIAFWTSAPIIVTLILFSIFSIVLSAGLVLENPYPPELFDTEIRGSGVGAVIAISRIGAAGGTFLLPIITNSFGVHMTLAVCFISLLIGGIVCQIWAPETAPAFMKGSKRQDMTQASTQQVQNFK